MQRYSIEVKHQGLGKYRYISGTDPRVLEQKAAAQRAQWEQQWKIREASQQRFMLKEQRKALAIQQTAQAEQAIQELKAVLTEVLPYSAALDWEDLKDKTKFEEPSPETPKLREAPPQPFATDARFQVAPKMFDRLYRPLLRKKRQLAEAQFEAAKAEWLNKKKIIDDLSKKDGQKYDRSLRDWEKRRQDFLTARAAQHAEIKSFKNSYEQGEPATIERYCTLVLDSSEYPECCPQDNQISYLPDSGTLLVEYRLPAVSDLPRVKQVRFVASRDSLETVEFRKNEINGYYDSLIYQICLRVIWEIFDSDQIDAIKSIVFNGWVEFIDPSNGKLTRSCIVSLHARCDEFLAINLAFVEPKACFRALKRGRGGAAPWDGPSRAVVTNEQSRRTVR